MRYLILFLCSLLLLACSQVSEDESLYRRYESYREQAMKMDLPVVPEMLSSELQQKYKSSDKSEFPILTSFYSVLNSVKDHYQVVNNRKGCLTVNGFDEASSPVSLRMEYVHERDDWYLSYVEIFYLDAANEFGASAVCPTKPPLMSESAE